MINFSHSFRAKYTDVSIIITLPHLVLTAAQYSSDGTLLIELRFKARPFSANFDWIAVCFTRLTKCFQSEYSDSNAGHTFWASFHPHLSEVSRAWSAHVTPDGDGKAFRIFEASVSIWVKFSFLKCDYVVRSPCAIFEFQCPSTQNICARLSYVFMWVTYIPRPRMFFPKTKSK